MSGISSDTPIFAMILNYNYIVLSFLLFVISGVAIIETIASMMVFESYVFVESLQIPHCYGIIFVSVELVVR